MIRILLTLAIILAVVFGAVWIAETPGVLRLDLAGYRVETTVAWAAAGLIVAVLVVTGVVLLAWVIWRSPRLFARFRARRREESGYEALSRGMVAVAAGDAAAARSYAKKAERKLRRPSMTRLLNAQAAQLDGDEPAAERYFAAMAEEPETEFLGLRGLIVQAIRRGDQETALRHAERAFKVAPRTPWIQTTLFELQADAGKWDAARHTLAASAKQLGKDVARRREAVLLTAEAEERAANHENGEALRLALEAVSRAPGLVPAAVLAARLLGENGQKRKAAKIVARAWTQTPHPDLIAVDLALDPEDSPKQQRRKIQKLTEATPDHTESRLARAEAAASESDWAAVKTYLDPVLKDRPSARACTLMALAEKGLGGEERLIRAWLARAVAAPRGAQWVCDTCGTAHGSWRATCGRCNAFDSLDWRVPSGEAAPAMLSEAATRLLDWPQSETDADLDVSADGQGNVGGPDKTGGTPVPAGSQGAAHRASGSVTGHREPARETGRDTGRETGATARATLPHRPDDPGLEDIASPNTGTPRY